MYRPVISSQSVGEILVVFFSRHGVRLAGDAVIHVIASYAVRNVTRVAVVQ